MKLKINSTKAFKAAVNDTSDVQSERDKTKRVLDDLRKEFDERHDILVDYALAHPEVFDGGESGRSREGSTDRVKYKLTTGEALARIDGGQLTDRSWLTSLPDEYVRTKLELNKIAIKGAGLTDEELAEILGLKRVETQNMKFVATAAATAAAAAAA